ncbi:MAG: hypothetical protein ACTSQH_01265 [Candidatus Hodarchaeales archaeon]
MLKYRQYLVISMFVVLILFSGCTGFNNSSTPDITELVVVGVTGETKTLSLDDIINLRGVTGNSVYENSYSFWQGKGEYTGVPLSVFAELVGGIIPGDILIVTTVDNYLPQIFSYENIYPSESVNQTQGTIILSYSFNGTLYPTWKDGLRIAFLPSDEEFSNTDSKITASLESSTIAAGPRWAKYVNRLEFRREAEQLKFSYSDITHLYSWTQILRFPNLTEPGRMIFLNGKISESIEYTGVNLSLLAQLANPSGFNTSIEIHSSIGDPINLTSTELNGNILLYNSTGMVVETENQVTFLLAFQQNNSTFNDGSFSIVVVGSNSPISDSKYWLTQVEEIKFIW